MGTDDPEYLFEHGRAEDERLRAQGGLLDPMSEKLLLAAGLEPGSRVLDLGSGAGNLSLLAARLVGPTGSVVGLDLDEGTVRRARAEAARQGADHVGFRVGDAQTLDGVEDGFDAVIGRLIAMYLPDPPLALSRAFARLRPGGLLCLQEPDLAAPRAAPPMPTWEQAHGRLLETMRRAGVEARMGHKLFAAFRAAGLPDPEMHVESAVRCGERAGHAAHRWADLLVATLPLMERTGVTTREQLAPDTLGDRLEAELTAHDGIVMLGPLFAAWARA